MTDFSAQPGSVISTEIKALGLDVDNISTEDEPLVLPLTPECSIWNIRKLYPRLGSAG
jgi:hypothetical protein